MKTAILFAGQGAQFVGMGKDLYDNFDIAKELFDKAEDVLKQPVKKICFEGPDEILKQTENTQPAILLMSYICYKLIEDRGVTSDVHAGFSLGEYSALTAAGYIPFESALTLVRERGLIMDKAVSEIDGGMAAILGLTDEQVEEICKKTDGLVVPANYNCPGQLVISGEKKAVEKACDLAEEMEAKRTVILNVSGPFHSPLLESASTELAAVLNNIPFSDDSKCRVVSNVTAKYHNHADIKGLLVKQMYSPVKWRKSIENLIAEGYDTFIEVGPGKVLSGFMRSIDRKKTALNVGSSDTLKKTIEKLEQLK